MPQLEPIGRMDPQELEETDFEPLLVPLVGYTADKQEIMETFRFKAVLPGGPAFKAQRLIDMLTPNAQGQISIPMGIYMEFLERAMLPGEAERFTTFIERPDLEIPARTLGAMYEGVMAYYAANPIRRRVASSAGQLTPALRATSRAAAHAKGSTSKSSRSASRATSSSPS
jgi:hypothetical protein